MKVTTFTYTPENSEDTLYRMLNLPVPGEWLMNRYTFDLLTKAAGVDVEVNKKITESCGVVGYLFGAPIILFLVGNGVIMATKLVDG